MVYFRTILVSRSIESKKVYKYWPIDYAHMTYFCSCFDSMGMDAKLTLRCKIRRLCFVLAALAIPRARYSSTSSAGLLGTEV